MVIGKQELQKMISSSESFLKESGDISKFEHKSTVEKAMNDMAKMSIFAIPILFLSGLVGVESFSNIINGIPYMLGLPAAATIASILFSGSHSKTSIQSRIQAFMGTKEVVLSGETDWDSKRNKTLFYSYVIGTESGFTTVHLRKNLISGSKVVGVEKYSKDPLLQKLELWDAALASAKSSKEHS